MFGSFPKLTKLTSLTKSQERVYTVPVSVICNYHFDITPPLLFLPPQPAEVMHPGK